MDADRESGAPKPYGWGRWTVGSVEERLNKLNWRERDDFDFCLEGVLCWTLTMLDDSGESAREWVSMMVFELSS